MVHYRGGTYSIDESVYPDVGEVWGDLTTASCRQLRGG
jgi:hypothetical protein